MRIIKVVTSSWRGSAKVRKKGKLKLRGHFVCVREVIPISVSQDIDPGILWG